MAYGILMRCLNLDARMTVSGGLDNGWRMASWSPSGLSHLGGYVACVALGVFIWSFVTLNRPQKVPASDPQSQS